MKKSFVNLLTVAVVIFGIASCTGKKAKEEAATEEAAVIAGNIPKSLLTEELKTETIQLLNDLPDSEIPYRISSGEVTVGVADSKYMLAVAQAAELTTPSQKARACGIYLADFNVLTVTGQPTTEVEGVLAKLTAELNISYLLDILKVSVPKEATKEEIQHFYASQEDKMVKALAEDDKIHVAIDILGGAAAEYACLIANPTLVVKGDATSAGLSENMEKRIEILGEITNDLSAYYPEMKTLGETILPLKDKVTSIQAARDANADILAIRDALLK
ncbi:hypothetical protein D0T51_01610 [Parabacteroides sp. 52]|uniref:hypothetical protein n=1 Tax=unclassified Parabacteroides TaxID=2649774 RepID=UPI0013D38E0A|nr:MULTISPECIES: hypothetical protein [unclassified Parabacteroides]MDH6533678.1 hypothetical protein [Parabacteroides sp. PM5-20]NDV54431.1 hypothetical protein [Parabacteroides sp. 52]